MSLYVEQFGQGPDLVLLHGWGMHGGVWHGVCDALAQTHRVHVIDLPGMGHSATCDPYTLVHLAQVVAGQMPARAAVCGWSLGGQVAMQLALDHPEKVDSLWLVGSTPRFVNQPDWRNGIAADVFREFAAQIAADYHPSMGRFLGLQAFGGDSTRQQMRELREQFAARPAPSPEVLQQALRILLETDLRADISRLTLPTLIIHGNRDTLAPVAAAHWMAAQLPHAQFKEISGASHAPFLSHPSAFLEAAAQFTELQHAG
jgi:pimeloyl-[acyl-carrier protein] methyl ester esterase